MKFNKRFLKRVLAIPSYSYREERMRDYILSFAKKRGIAAAMDKIGNVYLTKGEIAKGEYVPCFPDAEGLTAESQRAQRLAGRFIAEGKTDLIAMAR